MSPVKITIVGAGSAFSYGIVSDLIRRPLLAGSTVGLVDVNPTALDVSERIIHRMITETGADLKVESSTDRQEILPGSHFILNSISVGEPWARERDVAIGEKYGIYQPTSQTIGPAGFVRGLRVIPHAVAIAEDIADLCPNAVLINLTNPLAAVMRAMIREAGVTAVGLCHSWRLSMPVFASLLKVPEGELDCVAVGTNHLTWALALYYQGQDVLPRFLDRLETPEGQALLDSMPVTREIYRAFGLWPMGYDLHIAEFFPYFLTPETHGGADYGLETRHTTAESYDAEWARRRALADGLRPLGELLEPSGEGVIEIVCSWLGMDEPATHVVNIPNVGLVDNLPDEMIVELPAYVSSGAVRGLKVGSFPQPVAQLMATRAVQQELLIDAALSGDQRIAVQGLLLDAQITSIQFARDILRESLTVNAEWLPAFRQQ
jgi:alpha-galactosidase